jgi:EpsD family peptidyl-prolyl cis-trans isomerase
MRWYQISLAACSVLISACDKEPTGQVAAVVNGSEITLQEINAELAGANIPEGADTEKARQAALQRIVDRRLLADSAREEGLDKSPEFLVRQRQLEDALLVQLLGQKLGRTNSVPTQQEIDAFVKKNPGIFENRTIYEIDRIQFAATDNPKLMNALKDDHSMDAVAATLQDMNIKFERQTAGMDSARLGEDRLKQIQALPAGEPFIIPDGGVVTVGVITGQKQVPITGQNMRPLAVQALRNESLSNAMLQRLAAEKAKAKIEYKAGLAPNEGDERMTSAGAEK